MALHPYVWIIVFVRKDLTTWIEKKEKQYEA